MALIHEISITEIKGLSMGHAQDQEAKTGVTVLLFDKDRGAVTGCDISGGGPASRETPLTSPVTADNPLNAIVLSGGSAYGLAHPMESCVVWKTMVLDLRRDLRRFRWYVSPVSLIWDWEVLRSARMRRWDMKPACRHWSIQPPQWEMWELERVRLLESCAVWNALPRPESDVMPWH